MREALRVFREALRDTYNELFLLVLLNGVTLLLLVPVVTGPPALAGLWAVGNRVARGEAAGWRDYFSAFRKYFGHSWALTGLHLVVLLIIAANLWFYTPGSSPLNISFQLSFYLRAAWIGVILFWLLLSQHFLPLILEQEDRRLRTVLRNGSALLAARPFFSITQLTLILMIVLVSTALAAPWVVITPAFLAVLTNNAVLRLLEPFRKGGNRA